MKDKIAQYAEHLIDQLKNAEGFVVEQAPMFVQELLMYNFVLSLMLFIIGIPLLCVGIYVSMKGYKNLSRYAYYDRMRLMALMATRPLEGQKYRRKRDHIFPMALISTFCAVMCFFIGIIFVLSNLDWLQIWLAPRVYLVEYLRGLV